MLTTIAALIIAFGLMISLARRVRRVSADQLTKGLLVRLDQLMSQYQGRHHRLPSVAVFLDPGISADVDNRILFDRALQNGHDVLRALRLDTAGKGGSFAGLPDSIYDEGVLRDAWGTPIVFMPSMHPLIGMAPANAWFFFSAGPDRRFLTQEDNLYSYEELPADSLLPATAPASPGSGVPVSGAPASGGQTE